VFETLKHKQDCSATRSLVLPRRARKEADDAARLALLR